MQKRTVTAVVCVVGTGQVMTPQYRNIKLHWGDQHASK